MGGVLGIDYGGVRIGVALSDAERRTALARGTIAARPAADAIRHLQELVEQESVDEIVIGLPQKLDGTEGEQAARTRTFGRALEDATQLPVRYVDERLTSKDAAEIAEMKGTTVDAEAARLILQSWLDQQRSSS